MRVVDVDIEVEERSLVGGVDSVILVLRAALFLAFYASTLVHPIYGLIDILSNWLPIGSPLT